MGFTVSPSMVENLTGNRQKLRIIFTVNRQKCRVIMQGNINRQNVPRHFINLTISTDLFRTSSSRKNSKLEKTSSHVLKNTFCRLRERPDNLLISENISKFLYVRHLSKHNIINLHTSYLFL